MNGTVGSDAEFSGVSCSSLASGDASHALRLAMERGCGRRVRGSAPARDTGCDAVSEQNAVFLEYAFDVLISILISLVNSLF